MGGVTAVMALVIGILTLVVVVALVVWFASTRKHPENGASHQTDENARLDWLRGDADDRPAGPGAEAMGVTDDGQITAAPAAENLPTTTARSTENF